MIQTNIDRKHRLARIWSNQTLAAIAPLFKGDVVNVSAWEDRDKQGRCYKDYFVNARSYCYTNHTGYRGYQGVENEFVVDLTENLPENLIQKFDVVYNHTTLEHIFDVRKAFANLCGMSRDIVTVVVPFAQVLHEADDYGDYWRFTPPCLRKLFEENGLTVVYEAESPHENSAIYLLFAGSRYPERWTGRFPLFLPLRDTGNWIGRA